MHTVSESVILGLRIYALKRMQHILMLTLLGWGTKRNRTKENKIKETTGDHQIGIWLKIFWLIHWWDPLPSLGRTKCVNINFCVAGLYCYIMGKRQHAEQWGKLFYAQKFLDESVSNCCYLQGCLSGKKHGDLGGCKTLFFLYVLHGVWIFKYILLSKQNMLKMRSKLAIIIPDIMNNNNS